MEGSLQGQVDLCKRYPEHQPPPHSPQVSRGKPNSPLAWSNVPVQAIPRSVSLSQTLETLRNCCPKPVKKCYGSSIRTPPGRPYYKTLLSTRFGSRIRLYFDPHVLSPAPSLAKESGTKRVPTAHRSIKSDAARRPVDESEQSTAASVCDVQSQCSRLCYTPNPPNEWYRHAPPLLPDEFGYDEPVQQSNGDAECDEEHEPCTGRRPRPGQWIYEPGWALLTQRSTTVR